MISPFDIYLIGTMDSVCGFFAIISGISVAVMICMIIVGTTVDEEDDKASCIKYSIISFVSFIVSCLICCLLPSSKTLAAMIIIPPVVNAVSQNKEIQQIPQAVLDLIKSYENSGDSKSTKK